MERSDGPVIDMTPDGKFIEPPKPSIFSYLLRLAAFGLALAVIAALFWALVLVVPLLILAGVVAYLVFKPRMVWVNQRRF